MTESSDSDYVLLMCTLKKIYDFFSVQLSGVCLLSQDCASVHVNYNNMEFKKCLRV